MRGAVRFIAGAGSLALVAVIKGNSTKVSSSVVLFPRKQFLRPFLLSIQLNVCVYSVSRSVFFLVSVCLHALLPQTCVGSELIELNKAQKDEADLLHAAGTFSVFAPQARA